MLKLPFQKELVIVSQNVNIKSQNKNTSKPNKKKKRIE